MSTKENCLPLKDKQKVFGNHTCNDQYNSLNLNLNHQNLSAESVHTKSISTNFNKTVSSKNNGCSLFKKKQNKFALFSVLLTAAIIKLSDFPDTFHSKKESNSSWNKTTKNLDSFKLAIHNSDKNEKLQDQKKNSKSTVNNSTLSLHIAAYENSIETSGNLFESEKEKLRVNKKLPSEKIPGHSLINQNSFEFPRQQENYTTEPEVAQFKASQKLFNPNNSEERRLATMEGIPKVPMISPDMKIPDDPMPADWVPKLREYIFTHYNDDPSKFNEAFKELQSMRYHACRYSADTESICIMKRYYAQLQMMKSRFPMETNEPVSVSFAWSDRSCDMAVGAAYEDINYEICCIMYNIGAAHATIGMNETRSDEGSRKNAFQNFQYASWPFEYLRDNLGASKFSSSNFEPELLTFFSQILLVQAHECLIEKAIFDKRTNTIVSKLARYAAEAYFELKLRLDQDTLSDYILNSKLKTWKRLCEAKAHFYEAIKRFYLGQQCCEDEKHGESVAHLSAALEQIKEAQKIVQKDKRESESMKQAVSFALDIITQKEAKVRKENDFVYHDRVPKAEDLTQVEPVTKAQAISFDPFKRDTCGDDLFAALLPANVLKGVSMYSEEKAKLKREIIQKVEKKDTDLEQHLMSLQLNQLNLDQNLDEMRLPEELLQASAAFTAHPHGLFDLLDQLNVVATKSSEAEIKLTDLRHRLLNVKCPQLEEDQGFKVISSKVDELMDHHIQARANNTELQKALASQSEQLKLLALPLTELAKNICDKVVNVSETPEGKRLREMVEKVEEMKKGRIQLFQNFTTDVENDDITSKILAEKDFSMDSLFEKELKKHEKAIQIIDMNLNAQDKILTALTEANANFAECRRDIVENNEKRRSQCVALITAYQVFTGVKEKTEAATTFYNQLFALIRALEKSVTGMEDTFKGERERHEEEKRILAEKTKLYRERTAMESSINDQQFPPSSTAERRRPKLGDYMAFYRNKMAASQPQSMPSSNQQYLPPSSVPSQQQHLGTQPFYSQHEQRRVVAPQSPSILNGNEPFLPTSTVSSLQQPFAAGAMSSQHHRFNTPESQSPLSGVENRPYFPPPAVSSQQNLPPSTLSSQQQQHFTAPIPYSQPQQQRIVTPQIPSHLNGTQSYLPISTASSQPFIAPTLSQQQAIATSQPQLHLNGATNQSYLPPSNQPPQQQQPFTPPVSYSQPQQQQSRVDVPQFESLLNGPAKQPSSTVSSEQVLPPSIQSSQEKQPFTAQGPHSQQQQRIDTVQPKLLNNGPTNEQKPYLPVSTNSSQQQQPFLASMPQQQVGTQQSQSFMYANQSYLPTSTVASQQQQPFNASSSLPQQQQQQRAVVTPQSQNPLNDQIKQQYLPAPTVSLSSQPQQPFMAPSPLPQQQQQPPQQAIVTPQFQSNGQPQYLPPSAMPSQQQQSFAAPMPSSQQQQQQPQGGRTGQTQPQLNGGLTNQQRLQSSTASSNDLFADVLAQQLKKMSSQPIHSPVSSPLSQQQQQQAIITPNFQSPFNGPTNQSYLPPSTGSSQQFLPSSGATPQQQQQPLLTASIPSQQNRIDTPLLNGATSQSFLPNSPQKPFSASMSQSQQQRPSFMSSQNGPNNEAVIPNLSIAPSPYANMYKKPKPPVSNVPTNSPWHRNSETNSSTFEKK